MFYGIGIYHPKFEVNVGTLFRSAVAFGAGFLFVIGRRYEKQASDTINARNEIPLFTFDSMESAKRNLPYSCKLVGVELSEKSENLVDYIHPDNALYLLGAEDHGLPEKIKDMCHDLIQIPSGQCLNVSVAGSIVMYDRMLKND